MPAPPQQQKVTDPSRPHHSERPPKAPSIIYRFFFFHMQGGAVKIARAWNAEITDEITDEACSMQVKAYMVKPTLFRDYKCQKLYDLPYYRWKNQFLSPNHTIAIFHLPGGTGMWHLLILTLLYKFVPILAENSWPLCHPLKKPTQNT